MDAPNVHRVFDWLWTSGQLSDRDILELPDLGIEVVINLALPASSNALAGEAERVTEQGLTYIQIPVEWEAPEIDRYDQFVTVMKALKGRRIWLHCALNMRVSAFVYLYRRLELGDAEEQAMFPMGAVWTPNPVWQCLIDSILERGP